MIWRAEIIALLKKGHALWEPMTSAIYQGHPILLDTPAGLELQLHHIRGVSAVQRAMHQSLVLKKRRVSHAL